MAEAAAPRITAAQQRSGLARQYLVRMRTLLIVIATIATSINQVVEPGSVTRSTWVFIGCFAATGVLWWLLLWRRVEPVNVMAIALVVDTATLLGMLPSLPDSSLSATMIVILTITFSFFQPPWRTLAFSLSIAAALPLAGPRMDNWSDTSVVPVSSFLLVLCGVLLTYLTHHIRTIERRLEHSVDEKSAAVRRLELTDQMRERMMATVTHELRTPLTSTIGFVETVMRTDIELPPEQRDQLLALARDGGLRLLGLVEDLLMTTSSMPELIKQRCDSYDVTSILRSIAGELQIPDGRTLSVRAPQPVVAFVDASRIEQVVTNLAVNAINHGEGDIELVCSADETAAVIRVLDEGGGIPPEHLEDVFQPFTTFSKQRYSSGLGLSICKAIVEAHGGVIAYTGSPCGRSCFEVRLPLALATAISA